MAAELDMANRDPNKMNGHIQVSVEHSKQNWKNIVDLFHNKK